MDSMLEVLEDGVMHDVTVSRQTTAEQGTVDRIVASEQFDMRLARGFARRMKSSSALFG